MLLLTAILLQITEC